MANISVHNNRTGKGFSFPADKCQVHEINMTEGIIYLDGIGKILLPKPMIITIWPNNSGDSALVTFTTQELDIMQPCVVSIDTSAQKQEIIIERSK